MLTLGPIILLLFDIVEIAWGSYPVCCQKGAVSLFNNCARFSVCIRPPVLNSQVSSSQLDRLTTQANDQGHGEHLLVRNSVFPNAILTPGIAMIATDQDRRGHEHL
jgi:hypothetical protein